MGTWLSVTIDVAHALAMVVWVGGLPLLFASRWPQLTRVYAIYALAFVVLSQGSQWVLGECFLTTLARTALGGGNVSREWFTVRLARTVFGLAPSERVVSVSFDIFVALLAIGWIANQWRRARSGGRSAWWVHPRAGR
ncbi:MAG: hypothetical protein ACXWUG_00530 [Polyangiales bacterium]